MTIRPRRPDDLPACVAVLRQVHEVDGYPEVWQPDAAGWIDPPGTLMAWVAELGDQVTGHVSLTTDTAPAAPVDTAPAAPVSLSRLFVAPTAQGRGTARRLMTTALDWAEQHERDVILEVYAATPAVAVYEHLGWRYLSSAPATWTGRDGQHPTVRFYAAPTDRS